MEEAEKSYSKWIVRCLLHGGNCTGIQVQGLKFKEGPLLAKFKGNFAFFLKYNGGLKPESMYRHYLQNKTEHQFEVTPLPGKIKVILVDGYMVVDEEKLDEFDPEKIFKTSNVQEEEDASDNSFLETEPEEFRVESETQEITTRKRELDLKPRAGFMFRRRNTSNEQDFVDREDVVPVFLNSEGQVEKHNRETRPKRRKLPKKTLADFIFKKPKTKPRKCKKLKEVDRLAQHEDALGYTFGKFEEIEQNLTSLRADLNQVKEDNNCTNLWMLEMSKANKFIREYMMNELNEVNKTVQRMQETIDKRVCHEPKTQSQGKAFPDLANI